MKEAITAPDRGEADPPTKPALGSGRPTGTTSYRKKPKRFSVTFTDAAYALLEALADKKGATKSDTIKDALKLESVIVDLLEQEARIIAVMPNGKDKELIIR